MLKNQLLKKLPKSWTNVKTFQYQDLIDLQKDIIDNKMSSIDATIHKLSIILDITIDDDIFFDLEVDELFDIIKDLRWTNSNPQNKFKENINDYKLKSLNQMKLAEFIDIEHYISEDPIKNLPIISSILYKKYKTDEWNNQIEEPYSYDVLNRSIEFENVNISEIYGILEHYNTFKTNIVESYSVIFSNDFDDVNEEELDEEELKVLNEAKEEENNFKQFSWERTIYSLINGDITKSEQLLNMSLIYVFNMLTMKKIQKID